MSQDGVPGLRQQPQGEVAIGQGVIDGGPGRVVGTRRGEGGAAQRHHPVGHIGEIAHAESGIAFRIVVDGDDPALLLPGDVAFGAGNDADAVVVLAVIPPFVAEDGLPLAFLAGFADAAEQALEEADLLLSGGRIGIGSDGRNRDGQSGDRTCEAKLFHDVPSR